MNFQNSFTGRFPSKRAMYTNKDSHLTWSVLLHYLIQVEDSNMPPIFADIDNELLLCSENEIP